LVFEVKTDEKSPVGNHKSPFVELITTSNGEPVHVRSGQTELQIAAPSKPAPQPNTQAAAAKPSAQDQPAKDASATPAKPLSRLEKLRLQGKQAGASK
jgi:hypothetical protein